MQPDATAIAGWTLMVAGQRSGKTSFLRLLLDTTPIAPSATHDQLANLAKFVHASTGHTSHIRQLTVDVHPDEHPHRTVALTLIDTPSLEPAHDLVLEKQIQGILRFLDSKFIDSLDDDESKARAGDHHVHLCLYFLDPDVIVPLQATSAPAPLVHRARGQDATGDPELLLEAPVATNPLFCKPTLPATEINAIRRLSARVNVLPVIARADTLSNDRLAAIKMAIRADLAEAGIGFGIFDSYTQEPHDLGTPRSNGNLASPALRVPYAVISPDMYSHSDGVSRTLPTRHELLQHYTPSNTSALSTLQLGKFLRSYRWGFLDVLDPKHCDCLHLRGAIFEHMDALHKYTKGYLFLRFKEEVEAHERRNAGRSVSQPSRHLPPLAEVSRALPALDEAPLPARRHPSLSSPIAVRLDSRGPSVAPQDVPMSSRPSDAFSEQAYKQRTKKIPVACNFCRSRKLKCDGGRPACGQCVKRSNACDYIHSSRRRGPGRPSNGYGDSGSEGESSIGPSPYVTPSRSPEVSMRPLRTVSKVDMLLSESMLPPPPAYAPRDDAARRLDGRPRSHTLGGSSTSTSSSADPSMHERHRLLNTFYSVPSSPIEDAPAYSVDSPMADSPPGPTKKRSAVFAKASRQSHGSKVVACNFCRARKTKCDSVHPTCSSCARRQLPCNYVNDGSNHRSVDGSKPRAQDASDSSSSQSPPPSVSLSAVPVGVGYGNRDADDVDEDLQPLKKMRLDGATFNNQPIAVPTMS